MFYFNLFFLLQYPQRGKSQEDELVAEYVDHELRKYIEPWVTLPDLHHVMPVKAQVNFKVLSVKLVTSSSTLCGLDKEPELFILFGDLFPQCEK